MHEDQQEEDAPQKPGGDQLYPTGQAYGAEAQSPIAYRNDEMGAQTREKPCGRDSSVELRPKSEDPRRQGQGIRSARAQLPAQPWKRRTGI